MKHTTPLQTAYVISPILLLLLAVSGCTSTATPRTTHSTRPAVSTPKASEPVRTKITDGQSPVVMALRKYLSIAGKQDTTASKVFLSSTCKDDLVVECQANAKSGWMYSEANTWTEGETISPDGKAATVVAQVVFTGGSTFMASKKNFSLVLENGEWKISDIEPKPKQTGPGVSPL